MPASFSPSYYLHHINPAPISTDVARVFNSLMVEVDPQYESQQTQPSGSAYPSWSSVTSEFTMFTASGPLDMGDLIYGLASRFWHRKTGTKWDFTEWAGAATTTGWRAPLVFHQLMKYANDMSGESATIADCVLDQFSLEIMGQGESRQTQNWFGKKYTGITTPSTPPVIPSAIRPWIRRNADWVVELSAAGLGALDASRATVLRYMLTMPTSKRRIFDLSNDETGNTGYDSTVSRRVQPTIDLQFLADTEWPSFFDSADNAEFFLRLKTHDDDIQITTRNKLIGVPSTFQDDDDAYVITNQFGLVARSLPSVTVAHTQPFTAATGAGGQGNLETDQTGAGGSTGSIGTETGYVPDGITSIYYDAGDDEIVIAPLTVFGDLIPTSVVFTGSSTSHDLTPDRTANNLKATGITTPPFTAGNVTATFTFGWLPNQAILIEIDNSPVPQWWT